MNTTARYRIGIVIGGTFTDATLIDEVTGQVRIGKPGGTGRAHLKS